MREPFPSIHRKSPRKPSDSQADTFGVFSNIPSRPRARFSAEYMTMSNLDAATRSLRGKLLRNGAKSNTNSNIASYGLNGHVSVSDMLPSVGISGDDENSLIIEREKHEETKALLKMNESHVERLLAELKSNNEDLEEIKGLCGFLKEQNDGLKHDATNYMFLDERLEEQSREIAELQDNLRLKEEENSRSDVEITGLRVSLMLAEEKIKERDRAVSQIPEKVSTLESKVQALTLQLENAKSAIDDRDELLRVAEEEKRSLRASLFETRRSLEDATSVIGETSLALNLEVVKFMNVLQNLPAKPSGLPDHQTK